jgi:NAD(P)-dependent dehydrogenase (short-subunit alcohol dehydrogenase family)
MPTSRDGCRWPELEALRLAGILASNVFRLTVRSPSMRETPMTAPTATIRFCPEDLDRFRDASGDRNPIHCSADYASRTVYGQRLVYGALGALACLGHIDLGPDVRIAKLVADFQRPMFCGVDYAVQRIEGSPNCVRLMDGGLPVVTVTVWKDSSATKGAGSTEVCQVPSHWTLSEAVSRTEEEIQPGLKVSGRYHCDPAALVRLCKRWGVSVPASVVQTLLWGSYFTGMDLPGRSAVFFRLLLDFSDSRADKNTCEVLNYEAVITKVDRRLSQVRCQATLTDIPSQIIKAECISFVRPMLDNPSNSVREVSTDLAGKVALVIGGNRGLGAEITRCLVSHGCTVISTSRSPGAQAGVTTFAGSAGDAAWLRTVRDSIQQEHGKLDFLICNAFPAINPLRMESNAIERIQAYVQQATALVLNPLCLFMEMLDTSRGRAVIVSSTATQRPVKEWPHYVAAKKAIEGLAEVTALQYPRVQTMIVRPNKLLTEMTNTPMGRNNAEPPGNVASKLVDHLREPFQPGLTVLEFPEPS